MANPVPYSQLFDIDGLTAAIIECENASDQFSASVTEDFKRINTSVQAIKKSIEALNDSMGSRTIKLIDDASQQAIVDYAKQVIDLTKQVRDQQAAITSLNEVINANKVAVSDAKVAAEQYKTEQQNLKAQQEATKLSIAQQTLFLEQQKQALTDSKLAAQQATTAQQQNKTALSASNLANQQYTTTVKQNQAAQAALNTQIAQNRLQISNLALANRQAAQAQTAATGSYNEAAARLKALGIAIKEARGGFDLTNPAVQAQIKNYKELNDSLKTFDASMGNHQRNVGNYKSALGGLFDSLTNLALGYVSVQAALAGAVKVFDEALVTDANRASLQYILGSVDLADIKIKNLKVTANRLGLEFDDLTRAYVLFTGAAKASNFSLDESDKVFNSVARAAGILHLSSDKTTSALYALQEMISKGVVQSKELQRQLAQAIPGASSIMAQALGVTNEKLREMERSGELLASDVLPKFADQLDKTFAPGVTQIDSLQASFNRLKNTFSESVDANSNVKTFFQTFLDKITTISDKILSTVNSTGWKEFFLRLGALSTSGVQSAGLSGIADAYRSGQDKADNPNEDALNSFTKASRAEQIEFLKTQSTIRDNAYKAAASHNKDDIKYLNEQQALLQEIRDVYNQLYHSKEEAKYVDDDDLKTVKEIHARILELQNDALKTPGAKASDISRIEALKIKLKELNPSVRTAKDGFALLEEQIKKTMLALQDSIIQDYSKHQGKESENTKKLADAYENLNSKLIALQKLKDQDLLNSRNAGFVKQFGSLYPTAKNTGTPDLSVDPNKRGGKSTLGNDLLIGQNSIDAAGLADQLEVVAEKYAQVNLKIINDFKNRNITKLQYDAELIESERSQANEEYYLNTVILSKELENAKFQYGENSKQYLALKLKKAKLDEQYGQKAIADLLKEEETKRKIIEETIAVLERSASTLAKVTGNQGLGNFFSDLSKDALNGVSASEAFEKTANIAIDATAAYTDFAVNASKTRQAALEAEMQYEVDGAGSNAAAKAKIQAEYTKKIQAEQTKQAKLQKAAAAVEIIINTAVAISKTLATASIFGIPLIPVIAGLGAIELGLVLAQPIPQFEKGRESGPATIAEVNEKGPELIGKNGKYRFANKGQRGYTYLQKDEKVIRADETSRIINNEVYNSEEVSRSKAVYDTWVANNTGKSDFDYDKMTKSVADGLSKLPITENHWDEKGHALYRRTVNARIKSVRERNKL